MTQGRHDQAADLLACALALLLTWTAYPWLTWLWDRLR